MVANPGPDHRADQYNIYIQTNVATEQRQDAGGVNAGRQHAAAAVGFDYALAMRAALLCESTYHSVNPDLADTTEAVREQLALDASGSEGPPLRLVAEVRSEATDTYAVVARNGTHLFVAFRGSCTARNVISDIDYNNDPATTAAFAAECRLPTPPGQELMLHNGFVEAYRSLRPMLHDVLEAEIATSEAEIAASEGTDYDGVGDEGGGGLGLVLTGHSMGGAMAMLAALDFAHTQPKLRPVSTYTFAAPRVGDSRFARLFSATFPRKRHHWALQVASDAVPHLPFRAWGFEHPDGVAVLADDDHQACSDAATHGSGGGSEPCLRRTGDPGDSAEGMRPREGNAANWATCHDLRWYMSRLHSVLGEGSAPLPIADGLAAY
mmetsp:Transcript_37267/g.94503  ORF Transcript_37267/g.94503 Transcript_37267/m.94503 type:complete len:380 (+) Transcript_37267:173-1312(+)